MTIRIAAALVVLLTLGACSSIHSKPVAALAENPSCLIQTGSRFADADTRCISIGSSYSQEDIRRTGRTNIADALQELDPSITVRR